MKRTDPVETGGHRCVVSEHLFQPGVVRATGAKIKVRYLSLNTGAYNIAHDFGGLLVLHVALSGPM